MAFLCVFYLPGGYLIWRIPEDDSEAWMGGLLDRITGEDVELIFFLHSQMLHLVRPIYLPNWVVVGGKW